MLIGSFRRTALCSATAAALVFAMPLAVCAQEATYRFDIPAQELGTALRAFAQAARQQITFDNAVVQGRTSTTLEGRYTIDEGMRRLLGNSGLELRRTANGVLYVVDPAASPASSPPGEKADRRVPGAAGNVREMERIVVTGTHIRGVQGAGSRVLVIGREEIERSGYASVQDLLKALPQNFGGGVSEDNQSDPTALNLNAGAAANLRGLGADSTLVLVNGRRQAAGGLNGSFVDISSIAASAIDRIEVLTDGASALYGSDAVGGVINFILRDDFDGAESRMQLGTLGGDASETRLSQLLGTTWQGGNGLIGYQYYRRGALARADRATTADGDYRDHGGSDFRRIQSNPGNILGPDGRPAFAIPGGQDGSALTTNDLLPGTVNHQPEQGDLLAEQRTHSAFFSLNHALSERVELFVEGRFAERDTRSSTAGIAFTLPVPASNPFFVDPFGGSAQVNVAYNFVEDLGPVQTRSTTRTQTLATGIIAGFGTDWEATFTATHARETARFANTNLVNFGALFGALFSTDPATAFNPFGDGSHSNQAVIDAIRASQSNYGRSDVRGANVLADGPLFDMPGGQARLAIGADYRDEKINSDLVFAGREVGRSRDGRDIGAGFAELALPLFGRDNARPGLRKLDLSIAARHERYSDFGQTTNPKLGFAWSPVQALTVRGTWGTSFKAPRLIDLDESPTANSSSGNSAFIMPIADPQAPGGFTDALLRFGGNRDLRPEEATTWTAGFDVAPKSHPGFNLSVTYFDIDYDDRIVSGGPAGNPYGVLLQEDVWRDIVIRNPTAEQLADICGRPEFGVDCSVPPAVLVDFRLRNLAGVRMSGLDLQLRNAVDTAYGVFESGINLTHVAGFEQKVSSTAPQFDAVDTVGNPLSLRARAYVRWDHDPFSAIITVNHAGGYEDTFSQPARSVASWTTVDVSLAWRTPYGDGPMSDVELGLNVVNLFDREPPFVDAQFFGYDTANADLLGRILSVRLAKTW